MKKIEQTITQKELEAILQAASIDIELAALKAGCRYAGDLIPLIRPDDLLFIVQLSNPWEILIKDILMPRYPMLFPAYAERLKEELYN